MKERMKEHVRKKEGKRARKKGGTNKRKGGRKQQTKKERKKERKKEIIYDSSHIPNSFESLYPKNIFFNLLNGHRDTRMVPAVGFLCLFMLQLQMLPLVGTPAPGAAPP